MLDYSQVPSPCFVLDEARLRRNMEILDDIQKRGNVKIICALKGYSFWRSFPLIGQYLAGATASSLNEARLAKEEMGKEVHVFAPVYEDDEIDEIISKYSEKRSVERIPKLNLAILRIAIYEALYDDKVPVNVAISEAVLLAKAY
uniref:transcription antitermination factor NusB n=1 Tax=uncultured Fibrobacter sp. TaxID=261512 RepID=UPI00262FD3BE